MEGFGYRKTTTEIILCSKYRKKAHFRNWIARWTKYYQTRGIRARGGVHGRRSIPLTHKNRIGRMFH